ncbi:MAG: glutamyl-tRNA reductase [Armatimonadetes bacterium]|nr:glutamyl-tRNA reductase [Armatimonadota bacterium]
MPLAPSLDKPTESFSRCCGGHRGTFSGLHLLQSGPNADCRIPNIDKTLDLHVAMIGIDHRSAREQFQEGIGIQPHLIPQLLVKAKEEGFSDCVFLSTCNRVEMYFAGKAAPEAVDFFSRSLGVDVDDLAPHLFMRGSACAACHLFRVASGLESALLGETEIVGQIKESWRVAREAGMVGAKMELLFQRALEASKRVRTETEISRNLTSTASIAVRDAAKRFGARECQFVVVGAGQIATRIAKELSAVGAANVQVLSRNVERANPVAALCGGKVSPLSDLNDVMETADVVFTALAIAEPILTIDDLTDLAAKRQGRSLVVVDFGVPSNVELGSMPSGVEAISLDELTAAASQGTESRLAAVPVATGIIEQEVQRFSGSIKERYAAPTIAALMRKHDQIRRSNLDWVESRLQHLPEKDLKVIEDFARRMMLGFLEAPLEGLKTEQAVIDHVDVVEKLYDLTSGDDHL